MKCPHCGMNIRDNVTECGYCGGKIARRQDNVPAAGSRPAVSGGMVQKGATPRIPAAGSDDDEEDEEGGLSRILQPGEQVLIGSLNVSVKKFFFHAYLTDRRIFLIDTQEKKLRVSAKDVQRDTIAGSIVEYSENSDPVLVLSIRSPDDEIKTMKLVFAQNGMDRSAEIDEWIALLTDEHPGKMPPRRPAPKAPEPAEPEEEPELPPLASPEAPAKTRVPPGQETHQGFLEKQPPVKRLLSTYKIPEEEPELPPEPEVDYHTPPPPRRTQVRQVQEPARKPVVTRVPEYDILPDQEEDTPKARKTEVPSAMRVAMKSAVSPLQQQRPVRRTVTPEPDREPPAAVPSRQPVIQEPSKAKHVPEEEVPSATPQFCHNCGKKLPHSANFCPGCGTKLSQSRTLPQSRHAATMPEKRTTRTEPPVHEPRTVHDDDYDEDEGGETPVPAKPPIKKAPKGSEMTILHKFLRR